VMSCPTPLCLLRCVHSRFEFLTVLVKIVKINKVSCFQEHCDLGVRLQFCRCYSVQDTDNWDLPMPRTPSSARYKGDSMPRVSEAPTVRALGLTIRGFLFKVGANFNLSLIENELAPQSDTARAICFAPRYLCYCG